MEQGQLSIRRMDQSDIIAVTRIYAEVLHPDYISFSELAEGKADRLGKLTDQAVDIFKQELVSLYDSEQHGFFIAQADGEAVGFVLASLYMTEAGHEECWLDDIGVKNGWTKRGVGTALVQRIFDWAKQRHAKYVLLESGEKNASAHHLFEHLGFQPLSVVFWHDLSPSA